jgi:hypothetical protein
MPIAITDKLSRGTDNISPFAVAWEADSKMSHLTVGDYADMEAIAEWKRLPYMTVKVASENLRYTLGADITIAGQVWTAENIIPDLGDVLYYSDVFDIDGYFRSDKMRNIFLNDQFVVDSEAEMLALITLTGNFVIRTDTGEVFVKLNNDNPSDITDFALITNPASVISVNGMSGVVTISISNLLAIEANQTAFDNAVTLSPTVANIVTAIVNLTARVDELEANMITQSYVDSHFLGQLLEAPAFDAFLTYDLETLTYVWVNVATLTFGHVIQGGGTPFTQRPNLNFIGDGVVVTDDEANLTTKVTIEGGSRFRGQWDASANLLPTVDLKEGDHWYLSAAGTLDDGYAPEGARLLNIGTLIMYITEDLWRFIE